ncbi:MAG: lipoprotein signal peptidase [Bacteroidetes bacterium]|jgi:signal peptidase II|nr:lipoprotein signal peptidase [Bacteroidota bacterium]MCA6443263.1 lipoprotein signal peptidase [Bacteroidota bacterium]
MFQKIKIPLLTILIVLFIDQFIKIYIKLNYPLGEVGRVGNWCVLHFTENPGMAWGLEFGGSFGKLSLSVLRILACIGGVFYIRHMIKKGEHKGFIFCVSLILAGAMGNILDSIFYGLIFDKGTIFDPQFQAYIPYDGIASFSSTGYTSTMYGCVVDMFYFPLIEGHFPDWFPVWGGEEFIFFRPIFNIADVSISTGVILIIIFQKRFAKKEIEPMPETTNESVKNTDINLNTKAD